MGGMYCFTALHFTSLREYTPDILANISLSLLGLHVCSVYKPNNVVTYLLPTVDNDVVILLGDVVIFIERCHHPPRQTRHKNLTALSCLCQRFLDNIIDANDTASPVPRCQAGKARCFRGRIPRLAAITVRAGHDCCTTC